MTNPEYLTVANVPIITRLYGTFEIVVGKKTLQVYNNKICLKNKDLSKYISTTASHPIEHPLHEKTYTF